MNNTISACLVVRNEEHRIERCLRSLVGVVDEIIIVHDGPCEDRTLEICRKYTDKIFVRPYYGACDPHRVFAFEQATGDWILMVDADEYLSQELRSNLRKLVERPDVDLYCFIWPYPDKDGTTPLTLRIKHPYRACLARRSKLYFVGVVHEPLRTYGVMKKVPLTLFHAPGYDQFSFRKFFRKRIPWARMLAEGVWKDIHDIPTYGITDPRVLINVLNRYRKWCFIKIPFKFLKILGWHLYKGMWRLGLKGLKISLLSALDVAIIQYHVWRYKRLT